MYDKDCALELRFSLIIHIWGQSLEQFSVNISYFIDIIVITTAYKYSTFSQPMLQFKRNKQIHNQTLILYLFAVR